MRNLSRLLIVTASMTLIAALAIPLSPTKVFAGSSGSNTFSGTLTDQSGAPIANAQVSLSGSGGSNYQLTQSNGSYAISAPPGIYTVTVQSPPGFSHGANGAGLPFPNDQVTGDSIDLSSGDLNENLTFYFSTVQLTVLDSSGNPVSGANVVGQPFTGSGLGNGPPLVPGGAATTIVSSWPFVSGTTDANGIYSYLVPKGLAASTITLTLPNGIRAQEQVPAATTDTTPVTVQIPWYSAVPSAGTVSGVVSITSPDGTALTGISATPIAAGALPPGYDPTAGDLGFQVTGLTTGQSIVVTIQLPSGSNPTNILKLVNGTYVDAASIATINGDTVTLNLTDGGPGDEDGVANGTIVDPLIPVKETTPAGFYVSSVLPHGTRGHFFSYQLSAAGGLSPYKWKKLSALPKGLKLSSTGLLSGTPSTKIASGKYSISVRVTDATKKAHKVATATLTLNLS